MNSNVDHIFQQALAYAYETVDRSQYSDEIFYSVAFGRFAELFVDEVSRITNTESENQIRNHFGIHNKG